MTVSGYSRQRVWLHGLSAAVITTWHERLVKFSSVDRAGFGVRLCKGFLLILPIGYGAFLAWQEWHFRQSLASPLPIDTAASMTPSSRAPIDATAVATVLGLAAETTLLPSAEPLSLQASFILGTGLSKALLADSQGARIYQVGERLPGGSVLRRVESNHVVLWNKGREELLTLQRSAARFLRRFESQADPQISAISSRYLRPLSGQSE
ncbi:hypothetical protein PS862_00402 [Pseudomonas fluorescens]|uniref:Type II secretion system protein GspC N-terminal domain-containing protein n=2 Tax=Pseudomonas fluorescens TaxID=294 RepID=A0A5E7GMA0_PSEFL|nr:hypothetical protein PS639_05690 [Pseudomonas fluorescens]VVO52871.1 hypothetical protein PS862_00402 [Pseudomonas fluorescens]